MSVYLAGTLDSFEKYDLISNTLNKDLIDKYKKHSRNYMFYKTLNFGLISSLDSKLKSVFIY